MATKGFYGPNAKSLGAPTGYGSGNSSGGNGPAAGPQFTNQGQIFGPGTGIYTVLSDTAGNTLAAEFTSGDVSLSTDGGITFTPQGTIPNFAPGQLGGISITAAGTWIISGGDNLGNSLQRSTDVGATWAAIDPTIQNAGFISLGTDGAGNWVGFGNVDPMSGNEYGISTDDGQTWTTGVATIPAGPNFTVQLWDGAQWVLCAFHGTGGLLFTSPDGINYTLVPQASPTAALQTIVKSGGQLFAPDAGAVGVFGPAANVIALAALTGLPPAGVTGLTDINWLFKTSTLWIALDFEGGAASSPDFVTWSGLGSVNLLPGETPAWAAYDALNDSVIMGGEQGSICTLP